MCAGPFCTCKHHTQGGLVQRGREAGTPDNQGFLRRFRRLGLTESDAVFEAATGYPQVKLGYFREASPTGKPGGRIQGARLAPQNLESGDVRPYFFQNPPKLPADTKFAVGGYIDPWGTVNGKPPVIASILGGDGRKAVG